MVFLLHVTLLFVTQSLMPPKVQFAILKVNMTEMAHIRKVQLGPGPEEKPSLCTETTSPLPGESLKLMLQL